MDWVLGRLLPDRTGALELAGRHWAWLALALVAASCGGPADRSGRRAASVPSGRASAIVVTVLAPIAARRHRTPA